MPGSAPAKGGGFQDYVTVAERIEKFYERYPEGRIITHIVEHDAERGFILMRAEVYRNVDDALPVASGHAYELKSEGYVQRTSYIEVCETSSVGRALAMAGFEVRRGIASREEMEKAQRQESERRPRPQAAPPAQKATATEPADWSEDKWRAGDVARRTITDLENEKAAKLGINANILRAKLKAAPPWTLNEAEARNYLRELRRVE